MRPIPGLDNQGGTRMDLTGKANARTSLGLEIGTDIPALSHSHAISDVTSLQTALDGKAATSHTHTASDVSDFSEAVDDRVASLLVAGANVSLTYDDGANTLTVAATGGSGGGDVTGPASATDNAVARFDGTTGKIIQNSGASIDDSGNLTANNLSGTNTGDQTITLTGDVTGSGTGSFAATIANDAITNAKMADVATATIKGRATAGTGDPEDLTAAQVRTLLSISNVDNTSDLNKPISTATQSALDGKASTSHGHTIADVTNLQTTLDGKEPALTAASQGEMEAGTEAGLRSMSPLRVAQAIAALQEGPKPRERAFVFEGEVPDGTKYLSCSAPTSGTIVSLKNLETTSGTATVAIQIESVNVTGLNGLTASSTPQSPNASGANTYDVGDKITLVITSSTATDLRGALIVQPDA